MKSMLGTCWFAVSISVGSNAELSVTLDRMTTKAEELGQVTQGYTRQIEGSLTEADSRTRALTAEMAQNAE